MSYFKKFRSVEHALPINASLNLGVPLVFFLKLRQVVKVSVLHWNLIHYIGLQLLEVFDFKPLGSNFRIYYFWNYYFARLISIVVILLMTSEARIHFFVDYV